MKAENLKEICESRPYLNLKERHRLVMHVWSIMEMKLAV